MRLSSVICTTLKFKVSGYQIDLLQYLIVSYASQIDKEFLKKSRYGDKDNISRLLHQFLFCCFVDTANQIKCYEFEKVRRNCLNFVLLLLVVVVFFFQVKPRNVSLKELKSEILEQGNQIEKALDLGADIVAVQLINVISNILNSKNDTSSNFQVENQQVSLRQDNTTLRGKWYLHI